MEKLHSIFNEKAKNPVLAALWEEQGKLPKKGEEIVHTGDDSIGSIEGEKELIESMILDSIDMTPEEMIAKFQVDMNAAGRDSMSILC